MSTFVEHNYVSHSPVETHAIARRLVDALPARGAVIALHGDLGSGKTCFVDGIAKALGFTRSVTSPTFIIVNEYRGARPLFHVDLYRLDTPDQVLALGLDEYFERVGVTAIEWAERAGDLLPPTTIHVRLDAMPSGPDDRRISVQTPAVGPG
jgi:tRNA threonylcarbamoyladenosine biosynthesis protein TsaE